MVQAFNPSTQKAGLYSEISQVVLFSPFFPYYMEMQFEFYVLSLYLSYTFDKFTFFVEMCAHSESHLYILSIFVSNLPALSDFHIIHLMDRSGPLPCLVLCMCNAVPLVL